MCGAISDLYSTSLVYDDKFLEILLRKNAFLDILFCKYSASVVTLFNKINITIVIFLLIPRILNSPFSVLQLSLNVTFVAIVQN
jgi:hypothetical protein